MPTGFKSDSFINYGTGAISKNYDVEEPDFKAKNVATDFSNKALYKILHSFLKHGNNTLITVATRAMIDRTYNGTQAASDNVFDENGKQHNGIGSKSGPLLSGIAYCISSCCMILLNKVVLSSYDFHAGISLMLYQNFISVTIVITLGFFGVVTTERLTWKLIRVWVPVNLIFVCMLVTGMYSLQYINVAMVTVLKNMTNILTAVGETYFFRKHQNEKVWAALFLMIVSALCGGITDLTFHAVGYTWQFMNCIFTASYSLILRWKMDTAKQLTQSGSLNEVSMVLLNNSLSLPFAVFLIILFNEWEYVYKADVIRMPIFWVVATASGLLGLAISFTSMWFLKQTGPTIYRSSCWNFLCKGKNVMIAIE
uniref:GDP-mannose transporter GONST1 isoform X2 n=1 Tax=Elaeis guineensis var. tenera TaxID=51953 RepID=A0A8N4IE05_ELAGV|nr:GDP-mannose transporter GONST1 isoform X2 [Elaeis guineensis]